MTKDTQRLFPQDSGILAAAALLAQGKLVALPTETVYGLGADARDGKAVAAIYEAKGRPQFNPLIVHFADVAHLKTYVRWSGTAQMLADAFWPGPLTLVLPLAKGHDLSSLVTAGLDTVAVRLPAHPTAQQLLRAFGGPVAAPSANPSGQISATTADHVMQGLGGRINAVLDDGLCDVGVESTIIGLAHDRPTLLRAGGVPREDIEHVLGGPLTVTSSAEIIAPGQLTSHYAPDVALRLNARAARADETLLGFGDVDGVLNLSPGGDLVEAAAHLFDYLHRLNTMGRPIAVAPIPDHGLGHAINDRLTRAAAPRG